MEFIEELLDNIKNIYSYARTLISQDAEDIVQETLYKALKNQDKYELGTDMSKWLTSIAHNIFIDQRRTSIRRPTEYIDDCSFNQYKSTNDSSIVVIVREVEKAISVLSDNQRNALLSSVIGDKLDDRVSQMRRNKNVFKARQSFGEDGFYVR